MRLRLALAILALLGALPAMGQRGWVPEDEGNPVQKETPLDVLRPLRINATGGQNILSIEADSIDAGDVAGDAIGSSEVDDGADTAVAAALVGIDPADVSQFFYIDPGTSGHVLKAQGAGVAPAFEAIADGDVPSGIARDSEVAAGYQPISAELADLVSNCAIENDATPIPDSCVGDGSDSSGGGSWTSFQFGSTTNTSGTTPTTITGFTIPIDSSDNLIARCMVVTDAAAATTGVQITFAGPTATRITRLRQSCSSTSAANFNWATTFGADNRTASAGTTRCLEEWTFNVENATNGTDITAQLDSEVDTSAVNVFAESWCEYQKPA